MEYNYNKCPECGYVNSNRPDTCPSCGFDLASYRVELSLKQQAEWQKEQEEAELAEKENQYKKALDLLYSNQHKRAMVAFLALDGYKDSEAYAEKAQAALYDAAVDVFARNQFLSTLYTDSADRKSGNLDQALKSTVDTCDTKVLRKIRDTFKEFNGAHQSEKYINACDDAIGEHQRIHQLLNDEASYDQAVSALQNKKYRDAVNIFTNLGDFRDSAELLEKSKKLLAEEEQREKERKAIAEKCRQEERARQREENAIKEKKEKKKNTIISIAVLAALILGIVLLVRGCNAKYDVDNLVISVEEKFSEGTYQDDGYSFTLVFEVANKGSLDVHKMVGNFKIYNIDGECLLSDSLILNGIVKPDNILQYDVNFNLSETDKNREIYDTALAGLKITYQLTEIEFENYKDKEYKNSDVKVINAIASDYEKSAINSDLKKKFDEMLVAFQSADWFENTYVEDLNAALTLLDSIWKSVEIHDDLLEEMYTDATKYHNHGECEKAYYLFSYLKNVSYKDSAKKAQECYDEASTVSYDSSKPGKTGIIIEYGCMVSEVESGYDAEGKIQYMDDIVEIDGKMISATDPTNDIYNKLADKKAGDTVELGIYRNGSFMTVTIKLGYKYF